MANETIARALTDILNLNRTSVKGYQEAAEEVKSPDLKSKLSEFSQQRAHFVSDLEGYARQYGIEAKEENTIESLATDAAAAVHRGWINIKSAITGADDSAVAHHVLVDAVIDYLLDQHVDTIVVGRAVAELTDVHTRPQPDVLAPVERADTVFVIVVGGGGSG